MKYHSINYVLLHYRNSFIGRKKKKHLNSHNFFVIVLVALLFGLNVEPPPRPEDRKQRRQKIKRSIPASANKTTVLSLFSIFKPRNLTTFEAPLNLNSEKSARVLLTLKRTVQSGTKNRTEPDLGFQIPIRNHIHGRGARVRRPAVQRRRRR